MFCLANPARAQQNSAIQESENRNILLGGHRHDDTETEVVVPAVGREPVAVGGAHIVLVVAPRSAAHHPPSAAGRIFPLIVLMIRIRQVLAICPFPYR